MYSEEELELFRIIAEGEALAQPLPRDRERTIYRPLYHHPLPMGMSRYQHETLLRRILTSPLDKQVLAAITLNDAWCLEECYLRGAPVDTVDRCGVTPLHLAAQLDRLDCCMVLVNIGVDVNASHLDGMTPLGLALASKSTLCVRYLREIGAKERILVRNPRFSAASTVLELDSLPKVSMASQEIAKYSQLPHHHSFN